MHPHRAFFPTGFFLDQWDNLDPSNFNLIKQPMIKQSIKLLKSKMDTFECVATQSDFAHGGILAQF